MDDSYITREVQEIREVQQLILETKILEDEVKIIAATEPIIGICFRDIYRILNLYESKDLVLTPDIKKTCWEISNWIPINGFYYFRCNNANCKKVPRKECFGVPSNVETEFVFQWNNDIMLH